MVPKQCGRDARDPRKTSFACSACSVVKGLTLNFQYDFGNPNTFSAIKHKIICMLTGARRGIMDSRR